MTPTTQRWHHVAALLVVATALLLRLPGLDKGIWLDEWFTLELLASEDFASALRATDHPPLYCVLLRGLGWLDDSVVTLRLLSVLAGTGTVWLLWVWLRQRSPLAGLLAALLAATHPMLLRYSQELRGYSLLMLLVAGLFWCADRLATRGRTRDHARFALAGIAVVSTHLVGAFAVATATAYATLANPRLLRRPGLLLLGAGPPALVFVTIGFWFLQQLPTEFWMPRPDASLVASHLERVAGLDRLARSVRDLGCTSSWSRRVALLALLAPLLVGAWRRSWQLLAAAAGFVALVLAWSWLARPIFWDRTVMALLVPALAFAGLQAALARRAIVRTCAAAGLLLIGGLWSADWLRHDAGRPIEAWPQLATELEATLKPGDTLLCCPAYTLGPLRYALPALDTWAVRTFEPDGRSLLAHAEQLRGLTGGGVLLIVRRDHMSMREAATLAELDAAGEAIARRLWCVEQLEMWRLPPRR